MCALVASATKGDGEKMGLEMRRERMKKPDSAESTDMIIAVIADV